MNKKLTYEQPSCDLFVIKVEEGFLVVSGGANWSNNSGGAGGDDKYDDGDSF